MITLEAHAAVIATDSGGVQKEAYFSRVPCLILPEETEWVELLDLGATRLVGADPQRIVQGFTEASTTPVPDGEPYGRGNAAERILDELVLRCHDATAERCS